MSNWLKKVLKRSPWLYKTSINANRIWLDISPTYAKERVVRQNKRDRVDGMLADIGRQGAPIFSKGDILIDGMWDNPNYWLRLSLLRNALGLSHHREIGLLGQFATSRCARTFKNLGIRTVRNYKDFMPATSEFKRQAQELIKNTQSASDIMHWNLPDNVPGMIIYDAILKKQRLASVNIQTPLFEKQVIEALCCIEAGRRLLDAHDLKLIVLTHPFNITWGTLAWQALRRGIPMVLPFGLFGVLRFTHMTEPEDLFSFYDRPTRQEIDALPPERAMAMSDIGKSYLQCRYAGKADDLASVYAYQRNNKNVTREDICELFNWDPQKPIVAFYTSNWFDWPHQLGMTQFTDFLDWVMATLEAARENSDVNWLFKPHPCEDWFGGVALADMLPALDDSKHIRLTDKSWNNAAVMNSVDALITYHGTAGIEFAAMGKPVLVPDKGKYDDCGFVRLARSREDYIRLLKEKWWADLDLEDIKRRAEIFCGWWFCAPDWQVGFILSDDARQWDLYDEIPALLNNHKHVIERETELLREWYLSGHAYSHTYKMKHADKFILTNV